MGMRGNAPARYAVGLSAAVLALLVLVTWGADPRVALGCGFLVVACVIDTRSSRIPNVLTLGLLALGLVYNAVLGGWGGLGEGVLGALIGLSVLLVPYLMGGMGGGDVKAMAGLGALLGPVPILWVFLYTALAGGVLAVIHYALAHNLKAKTREWKNAVAAYAVSRDPRCLRPTSSERIRFPYAAAIAYGFSAYVWWGGLV
ncbi:MAG: A24 family peptidase [Deferrisomatales bacterium]|nr:A24 family peptidase [Deferrisomatales bacterium]